MENFKFGHKYEQFNWGLLKDNRRIVFRFPVDDLPQEDIDEFVRSFSNYYANTPLVNESEYFDRNYFNPVRHNPDIPDMVIVDHVSLLR